MLTLNFNPFPILTTERLVLRRLSVDDGPEIFHHRSDPALNEYLDRTPCASIDEAVALKASIPMRQNLINMLRHQLAQATALVQKQEEAIQQRFEAQLTALTSGTKKASEQEIEALRNFVSPGLKAELIAPKDLQQVIDKMQKEVDNIVLELDFTLSEANAKTEVEVNF